MSFRQRRHLYMARKKRKPFTDPPSELVLDAKRFVFSVLVEGSTFIQAARLMAWNDIMQHKIGSRKKTIQRNSNC